MDDNLYDFEFMEWLGNDPEVARLLHQVIARIPEEIWHEFPFFEATNGPSKWGAHVEDGLVTIDPNRLSTDSSEVRLGTVAHELAHVYLGHPKEGGLADENEADSLARQWGFSTEVDELREKYGPPTLE